MRGLIGTALLVTSAAVSLTACGRSAGNGSATHPQDEGARTNGAPGDAQGGTDAKFAAYTAGFNRLIDDVPWNLVKTKQEMDAFSLAGAKPGGEIEYPETTGLLQAALRDLKKGRAIAVTDAGGADAATAEADRAADALIRSGDTLLAQWATLVPYFKSRAYRDDGFAKARAADATVRTALTAAVAAQERLDAALAVAQRRTGEARRDAFKAAGNQAGYHSANTMLIAERFATAVMKKDRAAADAAVAELMPSLTALAAAGTALPVTDGNRGEITTIVSELSEAVGNYRDWKASGDPDDLNDMIENYNDAVEASNDLEWSRS